MSRVLPTVFMLHLYLPDSVVVSGLDLIPAICIRKGCNRPRAQNPRTGEIHDHCTIKCMRLDQIEQTDASGEFSSYFVMSDLITLQI